MAFVEGRCVGGGTEINSGLYHRLSPEIAAEWRRRTVHLMCGVPMGGDPSLTGADSFGRVWGFDNLYVNDSSLLPDAPGVNPQGLVMTIAARNADHFLSAARDGSDQARLDCPRGALSGAVPAQ